MDFTPLERDVSAWFAGREVGGGRDVARQLAAARPVAREFTGVGSFTASWVPADLPRVAYRIHRSALAIGSPQLDAGGRPRQTPRGPSRRPRRRPRPARPGGRLKGPR